MDRATNALSINQYDIDFHSDGMNSSLRKCCVIVVSERSIYGWDICLKRLVLDFSLTDYDEDVTAQPTGARRSAGNLQLRPRLPSTRVSVTTPTWSMWDLSGGWLLRQSAQTTLNQSEVRWIFNAAPHLSAKIKSPNKSTMIKDY